MNKVSVEISNNFCPQSLFLYGTYREDGTPNFGLFCWFSYTWDDGLGVMACIGGEKLTKDRIRATGMFSANLVSEKLLPLADYYGNTGGYDPKKMELQAETIPGAVLPVPVLKDSPWSFELEVKKTVMMEGSEVFLCRIRNILADEELGKDELGMEELMKLAAPVITTKQTYFNLKGKVLGGWGEPGSRITSGH